MIVSISIPVSFERIVHIDFSDRSSSSPSPSSTPIASASHRLIMEIAGPRSNLILVSLADQSILACAYQVSSAASIRPLQLLGRYAAPPPSSGVLDPTSLDAKSLKLFAHHLKSVSKQRLEKALYSALKGMSPSVAKRIMERATLSPSSSLDDLDDVSVAKLYDSILDWAGEHNTNFSSSVTEVLILSHSHIQERKHGLNGACSRRFWLRSRATD